MVNWSEIFQQTPQGLTLLMSLSTEQPLTRAVKRALAISLYDDGWRDVAPARYVKGDVTADWSLPYAELCPSSREALQRQLEHVEVFSHRTEVRLMQLFYQNRAMWRKRVNDYGEAVTNEMLRRLVVGLAC